VDSADIRIDRDIFTGAKRLFIPCGEERYLAKTPVENSCRNFHRTLAYISPRIKSRVVLIIGEHAARIRAAAWRAWIRKIP